MDFGAQPRWTVRLYAESTHRFHSPAAPGWFHRLMQRWLLGIVWDRL